MADNKEIKKPASKQMTPDEAKAYRASLYQPIQIILNDSEKRNAFKLFWAQNRNQYNRPKELEPILWIHLVNAGYADPANFEEGLAHFGLKKS